MRNVPGGKTGLICMQIKQVGVKMLPEFVVDTALIREIRALQQDAAKELGQLVEHRDLKVSMNLKELTDEQLTDLLASLGPDDDEEAGAAPDQTGTIQ
jgi:hypothetical protein